MQKSNQQLISIQNQDGQSLGGAESTTQQIMVPSNKQRNTSQQITQRTYLKQEIIHRNRQNVDDEEQIGLQRFEQSRIEQLDRKNTQFGFNQMKTQNKEKLIIIIFLLSMTFSLMFVSKNILKPKKEFQHAQEVLVSYETQPGKITNQTIYQLCPNELDAFHVYYNESDPNMEYFPLDYKQKVQFCNVSVIGYSQLIKYVNRWNQKFIQNKIILNDFPDSKSRETLLVLMKLFFSASTYIDSKLSYSTINRRCWKLILNGIDVMFVGEAEVNKNNIVVPKQTSFMRVRFPQSPQVKRMIQNFLKKKDILTECQTRQCLVVKCKVN